VTAADPRAELEGIFRAGLSAVEGEARVRDAVAREGRRLRVAGELLPEGARVHALAVGKAAAAMASALEDRAGDLLASGLCVTKRGHGRALGRFALREAGHPLSDAASVEAALAAIELVRGVPPSDVVLVLLSGGTSALLTCPAQGLSLDDVACTTDLLMRAGAGIVELNVVRKHLTKLFGGRLAELARGRRVEVLAVSDVAGDRLDVIGSGPCAPDPSTYADAVAVLRDRGIAASAPRSVVAHLAAGARGQLPETPKPGDPIFERVHSTVLASNQHARRAALAEAGARGLRAVDLGEVLRGEAREVGRRLGALARAASSADPVCLVAGGETTVTVRRGGRGGRSQELALAAALALQGNPGTTLLAAGTDGTDGPTDAAGAFADAETVGRGARAGKDALEHLDANDSYAFFEAAGGLFRTGPTGTNVMDLCLALRAPGPPPGR
jgi:hydroxypyruvate reductase